MSIKAMRYIVEEVNNLHYDQSNSVHPKYDLKPKQVEMIRFIIKHEPSCFTQDEITLLNIFDKYGYYKLKHKELLNDVRKTYLESKRKGWI